MPLKMFLFYLSALFLILFSNLYIASSQATCSDPSYYTAATQFICTNPNNYITASSLASFPPAGTKALTVIALFSVDSTSDTGCTGTATTGSPISIFTLSLNFGGSDITIMELVKVSLTKFQYSLMGAKYSGQDVGGSIDIFTPGALLEVKIAVDLTNNKANMATTYWGDLNYDAPLPTPVNFPNGGWTFDGNTKFWFGGGPSATKRNKITVARMTVWDGYLPLATVGTTPYPGEVLLGHSPVLVANYKTQDLSGAYGLADSSTTGIAYLGASTAGTPSLTNAPLWVSNSPILEFTGSNQYFTVPTLNIAQPNALVRGSLSISFWIQPSNPGSTSYLFRYKTSGTPDRFALKITAGLQLQMCAWTSCQTAFTVPGLSSTTWTLITANWAFRTTTTSNINCYYSVYANGQLVKPEYISGLSSSVVSYALSDVVRFGNGYIGKLAAIKIYSPGSLQANLGTWCTSTTCGADLGATNPPTCLKPASCHPSCSQCTDDTDSGCLVCASGKYFSAGKCISCSTGSYLNGGSCSSCISNCNVCSDGTSCSTCASGYSYVGSSCVNCPANCDICSSTSTCTLCYSGFYLYNGACGSTCPATTYISGSSCAPCIGNCDVCPDSSTCTTCTAGYRKYNNQCYNPCPITTYADSGTTCANCPSNCNVCSDSTTCTTCSSSWYLHNNGCVNSCPATTYISGSTCAACPSHCDTCNSPGTTCAGCSSGFYLHNGVCGSTCPTTTYISVSVCAPCPANCDTCSDGSTCTVCSPGYRKYNNQCYNPCPATTYADSATTCASCSSNCNICSDASTCTGCISGGYYLHNAACTNTCPATTFPSVSVCAACPGNCDVCSDSTTCTTCSSGYRKYNNQCYNPCPVATYPATSTTCSNCESNCKTCSDSTTCTECSTGFFLYQQDCYGSCPVKTFNVGTNCQDCSSNCEVCSDANTCNICSTSYYLYQQKCYGSCPVKTYASGTNCLDCSSYCDVCVDSNTCSTCTSGYYYYSQKCYQNCPSQAPYTSPTITPYTCYQTCPTATPYSYQYQCYVKCPDEAPYASGHVCSSKNPNSAEEIAKIGNTAGSAANTALVVRNVASFSNPMPFMFGSLMKLLQYTRYMNVSHSERLEALFQTTDDSPDFIPKPTMSKEMQGAFESHPLPYVFEKYELSSNFMKNEGDDILGILTYLAIFATLWVMQKGIFYLRNLPMMRSFVIKARFFFQNYLLSQFYEMLGDVSFAAVLELKTLKVHDRYSRLSFTACLVCLFLGAILYLLNIWVVYSYQKKKAKRNQLAGEEDKKSMKEFSEKYEGVEILFNDFEDRSFVHQAALIFFVGRNIIFCAIIALMYSMPLFQSVLLMILDLCLVIYYLWKRSIKNRIDFTEQLTYELVLLIVNICFFIQALYDSAQASSASLVYRIGEVVIVLNTICKFVPFVFLGIKLGLALWGYFKLLSQVWKTEAAKKKKKTKRTLRKMTKQFSNNSNDSSSSFMASFQTSLKGSQGVLNSSFQEGSPTLNIETSKHVDMSDSAAQMNLFRSRNARKMSIVPIRFEKEEVMSSRIDFGGGGGNVSSLGRVAEGIEITEGTEEVSRKRKIIIVKKRNTGQVVPSLDLREML